MRALFEKAQSVNERLNWQKILSVGFFLLVTGLLIRGGYWVSDWLVENQDAQIKKIVVLGKPKYTTDKEVIAAIKQVDLSSYFQLNVKAVQHSVQALPWVATVSVRKQWPDELQVYIVEHKPVVIWNSDLLLNAKGQVFQADNEVL
jgi:cell division protein FtsQ